MGSSSPKSLRARLCVTTTDRGPSSAVSGSPLRKGKLNIVKKDGSAMPMMSLKKALSPDRIP